MRSKASLRPGSVAAAVILASVISSEAASQSVEPFDMVCQIQVRNRPVLRATGNFSGRSWESAETIRVRFDPATRRFCIGECAVVYERAQVSDNVINFPFLARDQWAGSVEDATSRLTVNRRTGASTLGYTHARESVSEYGISHIAKDGTGVCSREPFSGFPEAMF